MFADMIARFPKLSRERAVEELASFMAAVDATWEHDGLDWAPELLKMLREFSAEASKQTPDTWRLERLHSEVHASFKRFKFLKGICFVLGWIDMIYVAHDFGVG